MHLVTKFDIGQRVYVVDQLDMDCSCAICDEELDPGVWSIVGAAHPATGRLEPLTIQAIFVISEEGAPGSQSFTILYSMKEAPGETFEESQCVGSLRQAMDALESTSALRSACDPEAAPY